MLLIKIRHNSSGLCECEGCDGREGQGPALAAGDLQRDPHQSGQGEGRGEGLQAGQDRGRGDGQPQGVQDERGQPGGAGRLAGLPPESHQKRESTRVDQWKAC